MLQIEREIIVSSAMERLKERLGTVHSRSGGVISVGRNIHRGDFVETLDFQDVGNVSRRDPIVNTPIVSDELNTRIRNNIKLYFKNDMVMRYTDLERYGTTMQQMNIRVGESVGDSIAKFVLQRGITALYGAISSNANVVTTGALDHAGLIEGMFKFGDQTDDIRTLIAPSPVVSALTSGVVTTGDRVSYGAIYDGQTGTLGRNLWLIDSPALLNPTQSVMGLTQGALTIDESEVVKFLDDLDLTLENAVVRFKVEGAYSLDVKGYSFNTAVGVNPDEILLGSSANWIQTAQYTQHTAGVLIKGM